VNKTEKQQLREELNHIFATNPHALLVSFSGLKVNDAAVLRRKLRDAHCGFRVVKNTIAKIAAEGTAMAGVLDQFDGTTAVAYNESDPIALAKVFADFSKENKTLSFKVILLDGKPIPGDQLNAVATMPTKPELLAKLLFLFNYPVTSLARVLQAPLRDLGLVLKEIKKEA
jgi:large subunit ribosomal protein L10